MNILNRKAIKEEAKAFISGSKWLKMFLACLPATVLPGIIGIVITSILAIMQSEGMTSGSGISSLVSLLSIPFTVAIAGYFLNHIRQKNPEWTSIYKEGMDNFGKYLCVGLITNLVVFLWSLLFVFPGIYASYKYFFVHHIIHDNPNLTAKQARVLSNRITNGFKMDLFILGLSFIPWMLLVACTFGLANLYVTPYMNTVTAMYYENLKYNAITKGIARPEEFGLVPVVEETPVVTEQV